MITKTVDGTRWCKFLPMLISLDQASNGKVTEEKIAKHGAREGNEVGNYEWTPGTLANNGDINALVNKIGLEAGELESYNVLCPNCPQNEKSASKRSDGCQ